MKNQYNRLRHRMTHFAAFSRLSVAFVFLAAFTMVNILPGKAEAAQITNRSIVMSDSGASTVNTASNGSPIGTGTAVRYNLKFTSATTGAIQGIVISFCDNTPFIMDGGGCTAVPGFSVGTSVVSVSGIAGTYTAAASNGGGSGAANHVVTLNNSSATSTAAGTNVSVVIDGFTNPNVSNHTYYARILTYTTTTTANAYTDAAAGSYTDYGGVALSTANIITITARVQETLTFCVTKSIVNIATCNAAGSYAGLTAPNLLLGHGTNNTLDSTQVDRDTAYSQVSTNAVSGVVIRMVNSNKCGGLSRIAYVDQTATTGCDIPPVNNHTGSTATDPIQFSPADGVARFGVNVTKAPDITNVTTGTVDPKPIYNKTGSETDDTYYGMNITADTNYPGVSSTYGDPVAASSAPVNSVNTKYTFAAIASNVTPSGIYTANVALIATGTF